VEAASQEILVQLKGLLSTRVVTEGMVGPYRIMAQLSSEAGFDDTDIDRALELLRQTTFEQRRARVRLVLEAVSTYQPGQPFKLEKTTEPYFSFDEAWTAVRKEAEVKDEPQSAVE
jgi:hypothetical protein